MLPMNEPEFITQSGIAAYLAVLSIAFAEQSYPLGRSFPQTEQRVSELLDELLKNSEDLTLEDEAVVKRLHEIFCDHLRQYHK